MKKNRKKTPEFKKPFLVLSRKKIAGWLLAIFFICGWMFVLGVLVGRDTAPVKFDIHRLQKKLQAAGGRSSKMVKTPGRPPAGVKDKTKLDFYEALEDNRPAGGPPNVVRQKIKPPMQGVRKKPPARVAFEKTAPTKAVVPAKAAAVQGLKPAPKIYTIQAAALRRAADADRLVTKLKKRGYAAYRAVGKLPGKGTWYRVRIGEFQSREKAGSLLKRLRKEGFKPILVLRR